MEPHHQFVPVAMSILVSRIISCIGVIGLRLRFIIEIGVGSVVSVLCASFAILTDLKIGAAYKLRSHASVWRGAVRTGSCVGVVGCRLSLIVGGCSGSVSSTLADWEVSGQRVGEGKGGGGDENKTESGEGSRGLHCYVKLDWMCGSTNDDLDFSMDQ